MLRKFAAFVVVPALIVPALLSAGCAKKTVVGKWTGSVQGQPNTMEFKSDGTFTQEGTLAAANQKIQFSGGGTYKTEGETLNITITSAKAMGMDVTARIPANMKQQNVPFKLEGDSLSITQNGATSTMTRAK